MTYQCKDDTYSIVKGNSKNESNNQTMFWKATLDRVVGDRIIKVGKKER